MMNEVLHGNCLELMHDIPDGSIDMILCDLPYGTTACKWDTIIPFEPLWAHYKRIIKPNGAIVLTASQPFTSKLVMSNIEMFKCCWVWDKVSVSNPQLAKIQPLKHHEDIVVFGVGKVNYYPKTRKIQNGEQIDMLGSEQINPVYKQGNEQLGHIKRQAGYRPEFTDYPKTIITIPRPSGAVHPTQKPVALFEYLIRTYTNEGDTVLDNCAGSGTTAIACIKIDRNYIVMEQEQEYIDVINERIDQETAQGRLF